MIRRNIATFDPDFYSPRTLQDAKAMAVGHVRNGNDLEEQTEDRWIRETAHTVDLLSEQFWPTPQSFVLDYGCGAGRIAKALIGKYGCEIVGADQSESMRRLARTYVSNAERFHTCQPENLRKLNGRFDYAYCIWVLQHSIDPKADVLRIFLCLKPGARLFVVNEIIRFVPTVENGFTNDGVDVQSIIRDTFGDAIDGGHLDPKHTISEVFSQRTYWSVYQKGGTLA